MEETEYGRALQLFKAMDRLRRAWCNITLCEELSKSQFGTLMALRHGGRMPHRRPPGREEPALTLSTLAEVMGQSLPALSRRITALEEMGYVERVPDPSDRRVNSVRLTPAGGALLDRAHRQIAKELDAAMDALGEQETDTLLELLHSLTGVLEQTAHKNAEKQEKEDEQC